MHANFKACAKKLLLSLVVCTAIISQNAGADNAMRNIFNGMMTTTSPASFETATRTGVVGGSFSGTVAKLAMRQPFVLFKGLTFQKLC
ncbi:hypothetical protein AB7V84_23720, partial [Escherichia coli]